jgi:xylose dehydrogenase (NAD/NADP)
MSDPLVNFVPDTDQWRLDPDLAGGCEMIGLGIYPLNTALFLLSSDPEVVYGVTRTTHPVLGEVDEHIGFHIEFLNDVDTLCTASHNS